MMMRMRFEASGSQGPECSAAGLPPEGQPGACERDSNDQSGTRSLGYIEIEVLGSGMDLVTQRRLGDAAEAGHFLLRWHPDNTPSFAAARRGACFAFPGCGLVS